MQHNPTPPVMYTEVQKSSFIVWDQIQPISHVTWQVKYNTNFSLLCFFARDFLETLAYQGPTVHLDQRYNSISCPLSLSIHSFIKFIQLNSCIWLCFRVCRVPEGPKARQGHKEHRWDNSTSSLIPHVCSVTWLADTEKWKIWLIKGFPLDH